MKHDFFPKKGMSWDTIETKLKESKNENYDWTKGRVANGTFIVNEGLSNAVKNAFLIYFSENALLRAAFPSLTRLEAEVVKMTTEILQGDENVVGNMTSGGTESIFLAMKSARDYSRETNPNLTKPNIVVPQSAHPAYYKSAHYLDIEVNQVPTRTDYRADPKAMADAIDKNTIMMVGSAPEFSFGVMDPIEELGEIAMQKKVWLHVDGCIGGYFAPFVRKLGYPVPKFEFSVPGVTTISADLHKMGYAAKPASTILYRNEGYYRYQQFSFNKWPRGIYSVPTFTGSKPAGAIAAAWATLKYLGEEGYLDAAQKTMEVRQHLYNGITEIPEFKILAEPELCIFTFNSDSLDMQAIAAELKKKEWYVGFNTEPPAIHWFLTPYYSVMVDDYIKDLNAVVNDVKSGKTRTEKFNATY